jgi:hypothetical protein
MPEAEGNEIVSRLAEINEELNNKQIQLEEIKRRAQDPQFLTQEENDEMNNLISTMKSLEKERSKLSPDNQY